MKIWYQPTQNAGLQWIRYYSYAKYLPDYFESSNFNQHVPNAFWESLLNGSKPREIMSHFINLVDNKYDAVIMQRVHNLAGIFIIDFLQQAGIKVFTEIDDGLYMGVYQPSYKTFQDEGRDITIEQLEMSDGIIVTTSELKKEYSKYNDNIEIVRNAIDEKFIANNFKKNTDLKLKNDKIKILYSFSASHDGDVKMVYPYLLDIANEFKNEVEIVLFGGCLNFLGLKDDIIKKLTSHKILDYYDKLSDEGFDIGIAPLVENEFNNCKSNFRFIEYSALGVPTLASYSPDFKKAIDEGYCFRADFANGDNWYKQLRGMILLGKETLSDRGLIAKQWSHDNYNKYKEAKKLESFIVNNIKK